MKKPFIYILASAGLFFALSGAAIAETSTYFALYDNELNSRTPDTVNATGVYINIGHRSTYGDEIMQYIGKFSFDKIDNIQKAVVKLDRVSNSWDNDAHGYGLYVVTSPWDTQTATYNNIAPIVDLKPAVNGVQGSYGVFEFDVTELVKSWMNGSMANNGFMIKKVGDTNITGNEYGQFASVDYPTGGAENRPVLEITWITTPTGTDLEIFTSCFGQISPTGTCANADFNSDGIVNSLDLGEFKSALQYDLSGDQFVDLRDSNDNQDLNIIKSCFFQPPAGDCASADFNGDGSINSLDLGLFKSAIKYDLNGDEKVDLTGTTITPAPTISYFTPSSGLTGSDVTIYGSNLGESSSVVFTDLNVKGGVDYTVNQFKGYDTQLTLTLPTYMPASTYSITVKTASASVQAPNTFTVTEPIVTPWVSVLSPNGGEVWEAGKTYTIQWTGVGSPERARVLLYKGNTDIGKDAIGSLYYLNGTAILDFNTGFDIGHYTWNIPNTLPAGNDYRIGIIPQDNDGTQYYLDQSDAPFTIISSSISTPLSSIHVLSPNSGEEFIRGEKNIITWTGGKEKVQIGLVDSDYDSTNGNSYVRGWIETNGAPNGSVYWDGLYVTDLLGKNIVWYVEPGKYKIIAVSSDAIGNYCTYSNVQGECNTDQSDAPFSIIASATSIITPTPQPILPPITTTPPAGAITRNLWHGMGANDDIIALQKILNTDPETRLAESGDGSPGHETAYFGFLTQSAIQNFQCKHSIVCSGTPDSTGYGVVGPKTRVKLNEIAGQSTTSSNNTSSSEVSTPSAPSSGGSSGLSTSQIDAIINLLQAFGAEQSIIDSVRNSL